MQRYFSVNSITKWNFFSDMMCCLLFVMVFTFQSVAGDGIKKIKIDKASGTGTGDEKTSIDEVRNRAVNEAKIEALKLAGIAENISSYQNLYKTEDKKDYSEIFQSDVLVNIRGCVVDVKIEKEEKGITPEGFLKVSVTISCTVLKFTTEPDLTLDAKVEGVSGAYRNNDKMTLRVLPNIDCYMRIFQVSHELKQSSLLYPNDLHANQLFTKNKEYQFPNDRYDLIMETNLEIEKVNLIIVLIKEDIPYTDNEVSYEKIYRWINTIPPDKRKIITQGFSIVKK